MGLQIDPFFVVTESGQTDTEITSDPSLEFGVADTGDLDALLRLQREHTRESLGNWMAEGKLCFVAKQAECVVALMWADLEAFNYPPAYRELEHGEAYLFAAIADPKFRGRSVAPALRQFCYGELRDRGITDFYSYTDYFNYGARRFKAKLNACETELCVFVDIWSLWSGTFTLRRFNPQP